jgi:ubiquinone/menaquinone biosynthesis C-methylase UbiE
MMTHDDARFWNGIAQKYSAKPVANVPAFERKKAITRQHLRPDSRVLELGCGTGTLALEMARHASHIQAMDISAEMLRIAEQKREAQGVTNVTFRQGTLDGGHPYQPESFDSTWAYSILHLVPDRRRVLATFFDLLKPGGSLITSSVCLGDTWVPHGPIIAVMRWFGKAPVVHVYSRETMFRELREIGFVDVTERDVGAEKTVAFVVAKKPARSP